MARGEDILDGGGGKGRRERKFSSLPVSLPSFPFSPETPDTQANSDVLGGSSRVPANASRTPKIR